MEPSPGQPGASFVVGELSIDYARRRVALAGEPVELTATEYAVLYQLAAQAPRVLTHGLLVGRVWGPERVGEGSLLRNVVKNLRRKLGEMRRPPGTSSPSHGWGTGCRRGRGQPIRRKGLKAQEGSKTGNWRKIGTLRNNERGYRGSSAFHVRRRCGRRRCILGRFVR